MKLSPSFFQVLQRQPHPSTHFLLLQQIIAGRVIRRRLGLETRRVRRNFYAATKRWGPASHFLWLAGSRSRCRRGRDRVLGRGHFGGGRALAKYAIPVFILASYEYPYSLQGTTQGHQMNAITLGIGVGI